MLNPRSKCASGLQGMTVLQIPMNLSWGVETIRRLLPEMEKELQPDRQIAPLFDWNEIKDIRISLILYCVIHFTNRQ